MLTGPNGANLPFAGRAIPEEFASTRDLHLRVPVTRMISLEEPGSKLPFASLSLVLGWFIVDFDSVQPGGNAGRPICVIAC